jgi:formylglycine-generating enzyme
MARSIVCFVAVSCTIAIADDAPTVKGSPHSFACTKAGQVRDDNGLKLKLAWCPPSHFKMGSATNDTQLYPDDERPVEVTLTKGFWIGQFEVTREQWQLVMGTAPWRKEVEVFHGKTGRDGKELPASDVSWNDAIKFCTRLTEQERRAARLPTSWRYAIRTEAEWEYACRAGARTNYCFGDAVAQLNAYAWYTPDNKIQYFHPPMPTIEPGPNKVGLKKPNAWGLYDMHGNVSEWCRGVYARRLPGGYDPDVTIGLLPTLYASRGGAWINFSSQCRCAIRHRAEAVRGGLGNGFRVALQRSLRG